MTSLLECGIRYTNAFDVWVAKDLAQKESENEALEDVTERCLNLLIAQEIVQVAKKKLNENFKTILKSSRNRSS